MHQYISINPAEADICNGIVNMWAQSGFAEGKNQESVRNGGNRIIWSPTTRINSSYIKEIFSDKSVINLGRGSKKKYFFSSLLLLRGPRPPPPLVVPWTIKILGPYFDITADAIRPKKVKEKLLKTIQNLVLHLLDLEF